MFRTDDLALTTFLKMNGHEHTSIEVITEHKFQRGASTRGTWVFDYSDDDDAGAAELRELAAEYDSGNAVVEPREFARRLAEVRGGLYDALRGPR